MGEELIHHWSISVEEEDLREEFGRIPGRDVYQVLKGLFPSDGDDIFKGRDGVWMIKTKSETDYTNITQVTIQGKDYPVKTSENTRRITIRGEFKHSSTLYYGKDEILEELKKEHPTVVDVQKESKFYQGNLEETGKVIITFKGRQRPEKIKFIHMQIDVEDHIPKPKRCTNCQEFRHLKRFCERPPVCCKCAGDHVTAECKVEGANKCVNCNGEHWASSWGCPIYRKEEKVEEIRERERLTYRQAAYKASRNTPPDGNSTVNEVRSYAGAVGTPVTPNSSEQSIRKQMEDMKKEHDLKMGEMNGLISTLTEELSKQNDFIRLQAQMIYKIVNKSIFLNTDREMIGYLRELSDAYNGSPKEGDSESEEVSDEEVFVEESSKNKRKGRESESREDQYQHLSKKQQKKLRRKSNALAQAANVMELDSNFFKDKKLVSGRTRNRI